MQISRLFKQKISTAYNFSTTITLKRVVVTGLGMVSPLGSNVESSWNSLIQGKSGIRNIREIDEYKDNKDLPDCMIAPVHPSFDRKKYEVSVTKNLSNTFAMGAVDEALRDANWFPEERDELERTGVNIGVLASNIPGLAASLTKVGAKGSYENISRLTMLHVLNNMPTANVTIKYKFMGPSSTNATACSTGASSIGDGFRFIQLGEADVMVVGGTEESVNPTIIYASTKMQAMCTKKFNKREETSRPFDAARAGFVLGEGSGILVLEELEHAKKRGAKIYAELVAYGCSSDGHHLTRPETTGDGAFRAMRSALRQGRISSQELDHINTHATSTPAGDLCEARAIGRLLENNEELLGKVSITANKSAMGHCFGAAGSVESIFTVLSMYNSQVPAILNLENPESEIPLNYVRNGSISQNIKYALKNSFGFGGTNTSLLFKKYQE